MINARAVLGMSYFKGPRRDIAGRHGRQHPALRPRVGRGDLCGHLEEAFLDDQG